MMKGTLIKSLLIIVCMALIAGCTVISGSPSKTAKEWYTATMTMDNLKADDLVCMSEKDEFREQLALGSAFIQLGKGLLGDIELKVDLSKMSFDQIQKRGNTATVHAHGELRGTVGGVLKAASIDETWVMLKEDGGWKWCGIFKDETPVTIKPPKYVAPDVVVGTKVVQPTPVAVQESTEQNTEEKILDALNELKTYRVTWRAKSNFRTDNNHYGNWVYKDNDIVAGTENQHGTIVEWYYDSSNTCARWTNDTGVIESSCKPKPDYAETTISLKWFRSIVKGNVIQGDNRPDYLKVSVLDHEIGTGNYDGQDLIIIRHDQLEQVISVEGVDRRTDHLVYFDMSTYLPQRVVISKYYEVDGNLEIKEEIEYEIFDFNQPVDDDINYVP